MPFRIVLNTLLKISLEKTSFSWGLEQTCRHESFYWNFFLFGHLVVFINGYELRAPVFVHLHELQSLSNWQRLKCFSLFIILHRCFYHLTTSLSYFRRPRVCLWQMKWMREKDSLLFKIKLLWQQMKLCGCYFRGKSAGSSTDGQILLNSKGREEEPLLVP